MRTTKLVFLIFASMPIALSLILFSLYLNPYTIPYIDRMLLLAPGCASLGMDSSSIGLSISDQVIWYVLQFGAFIYWGKHDRYRNGIINGDENGICELCERYQRIRCHFRVHQIDLDPIFWWDKAALRNITVISTCVNSDSNYLTMPTHTCISLFNPWFYILPFIKRVQQKPIGILLDIHDDDTVEARGRLLEAKSGSKALEASSLYLNWHDFSHPVVDMHLSNITISLNYGIGDFEIPILDKAWDLHLKWGLEIPVPSLKLGNWTIKEVVGFIPDPPEEEGMYPRLGVVQLEDVILNLMQTHDDDDDSDSTTQDEQLVLVPNALFSPLKRLTSKVGAEGVDQIQIGHVLKEASIEAIQIYIRGQAQQVPIFQTVQKSQIFLQTCHYLLEEFLRSSGQRLDREVSILIDMIQKLLKKWEKDWEDLVSQQQDQITKFANGFKEGWETLEDTIQNFETNNKKVWEGVKQDWYRWEENVGNMMEDWERRVDDTWHQVKKDINEDLEFDIDRHLDGLGKNLKKIMGSNSQLESKFEHLVEHLWKEVKTDLEFDLDFVKERTHETTKAVRNGWDFTKDRIKGAFNEARSHKERKRSEL